MSDVTVFIVDDQRLVREGVASLLDIQEGISVVGTAADGNEAVRKALEDKPDVILMDIYMPGCSGLELTMVIRQEEAFVGVPIVFLSRETDRMKQIAALEEGGDDFFTKPMPPDQLVPAIAARAQRGRTLRLFMERESGSVNDICLSAVASNFSSSSLSLSISFLSFAIFFSRRSDLSFSTALSCRSALAICDK